MNINDRKLWLFGLLLECPMGEPLQGCPVNSLRSLAIQEKLNYLETLSETQINKILEEHTLCLENREKSDILFNKGFNT